VTFAAPRQAPNLLASAGMDNTEVEHSLVALGDALTRGDAHAVAECWDIPALVLTDDTSIAVGSRDQVEGFFTQAIADYRRRGIVSTRPLVRRIAPLSDKLVAVDVHWPAFDTRGDQREIELSHYVLGRGDDGRYRVRMAITHPQ
jgi:hypothetical protein